jgi:hypothetical protein
MLRGLDERQLKMLKAEVPLPCKLHGLCVYVDTDAHLSHFAMFPD